MRAEHRPPLTTAVGALAAQPDASVVRIRTFDEPGNTYDEQSDRPDDERRCKTRAEAAVIEFAGSVSSDDVAERIGRISEDLIPPPKALCIAVDHDVSGDGLWKTLKRATPSRLTFASIERSLEATEYRPVAAFLSPDGLDTARSFYGVGSKLYTPPRTAHPLHRLANVLGMDRFTHASTVIFATRARNSGLPVVDSIREWLPDDCRPAFRSGLEPLGFQIRNRGTLLLFVESGTASDRIVAKLSLREEADASLRNSFGVQRWLTRAVSGSLRSVIPTPIALVQDRQKSGRTASLESMERGVVAWKVNEGRRRSKIEQVALGFLEELQEQTRRTRLCDEDVLNRLLHPAIARAESSVRGSGPLLPALRRTAQCIREFHLGKQVGLVASHGDFGIGNILVERRSGRLTAVLDWADGRRLDFPSVDPFNWLIQQRRDQEGLSFVEAVEMLRSETLDRSPLVVESFLVDGRSLEERTLAAVQTAAFRYVERSLTYPWAFRSDCGSPAAVANMLDRLSGEWRAS